MTNSYVCEEPKNPRTTIPTEVNLIKKLYLNAFNAKLINKRTVLDTLPSCPISTFLTIACYGTP
jgi:hypothetical protein